MRRPAIFIACSALLLAISAWGYLSLSAGSRPDGETVRAFESATEAAKSGSQEEAIAGYQAMIDGGKRSASIYYNLASLQQRAGDTGSAILNYERASALDPGAPDIAANLASLRKEQAVVEPQVEGWRAIPTMISPRAWSGLAALALLATALVAAAGAIRVSGFTGKLMGAVAGLAAVTIGVSIWALVRVHEHAEGRAIVMKPGTPLRVSPFDEAEAVTELPAGRTVRLSGDRNHGGFRLAQLPGGPSGWLKEDEASFITER